jgi:hypothetical protein
MTEFIVPPFFADFCTMNVAVLGASMVGRAYFLLEINFIIFKQHYA